MNVEELEALFRVHIDDRNEPYLISSSEFLDYLNEAQEEACIRSRLLFDRTSDFCTIAVTAGKDSYTLDESVYAIVDAFVTDSGGAITPLFLSDRIELDRVLPDWRELNELPQYLIQYDDHIELVPKPSEDVTVNIECHVLPEELTSTSHTPQISRVNHRRLLHWVKYRAYDMQDSDILDKSKSLEEKAMFEKIFGIRPNARNTRMQYMNREHRNKVCI